MLIGRKEGREAGREANWNGGGKKEAGRDEGGVPWWGQRRPPTVHTPRCCPLPSLAVFSHGWVPQVGRRRQRRAGQSPPPSEPHLEPLACVAPSEAASELCPTAAQYGEQDRSRPWCLERAVCSGWCGWSHGQHCARGKAGNVVRAERCPVLMQKRGVC